jgi:hypothetical protein
LSTLSADVFPNPDSSCKAATRRNNEPEQQLHSQLARALYARLHNLRRVGHVINAHGRIHMRRKS